MMDAGPSCVELLSATTVLQESLRTFLIGCRRRTEATIFSRVAPRLAVLEKFLKYRNCEPRLL